LTLSAGCHTGSRTSASRHQSRCSSSRC